MSAQQAHHIIPVQVFNKFREDFENVFGSTLGTDFQQLGGNFIYLYIDDDNASKAKQLLEQKKDLFGDLSLGGSKHLGDHPSYSQAVESRLSEIFRNTKLDIKDKQMMILDLQRGLK